MRGKTWWTMFLVVAALLALGVGSVWAQGPTVEVTLGMSEFKFDPSELDVAQGATVTFNVSNSGQFPHNVTFVAPDGTESNLFDTNLAAGQSRTGTFTFNQAGEWRMYCPVGQHEEQGMVGKVRVAAAGGAGAQQSTVQQPSALPTTGGGLAPIAGALAVAAGALAAGLRLRRR